MLPSSAIPSTVLQSLAAANLVPSGATYSSILDSNATDQFGSPSYFYWLALNPAVTYSVIVPGYGTGNDVGIGSDTNSYADFTQTDGLFTPLHALCEVVGASPGSIVGLKIAPVSTNMWAYGLWQGIFDGTLTANSSVPDSALQNDVLIGGRQIHGGQIWCLATNSFEHFIAQNGSGNGSTLSLLKADVHGYCDINFFSVNAASIPSLVGIPSAYLRFAIGCGVPGTNQFPYNQPYIESYADQYPFYFVGSGHIFGGFSNAPNGLGDFVWFRNSTNEVMMRVSTEDSANEFFYPVTVKSNLAASTITVTNSVTIGAAQVLSGTGSPNSVVAAPQGSIFLRTDGGIGTTLYVKETGSGNTGWTAK